MTLVTCRARKLAPVTSIFRQKFLTSFSLLPLPLLPRSLAPYPARSKAYRLVAILRISRTLRFRDHSGLLSALVEFYMRHDTYRRRLGTSAFVIKLLNSLNLPEIFRRQTGGGSDQREAAAERAYACELSRAKLSISELIKSYKLNFRINIMDTQMACEIELSLRVTLRTIVAYSCTLDAASDPNP